MSKTISKKKNNTIKLKFDTAGNMHLRRKVKALQLLNHSMICLSMVNGKNHRVKNILIPSTRQLKKN